MTKTRSLHTMQDLQPGDHLCCLYETEEEHRAVLTPFVRQGLERGERVLYIVDARTAETVLGYLRDEGLDAESYVSSGQMAILTADDAYLKDGVFDPDGMIDLLRTETERALAEGYSALRVTGEMTWALRGLPGSERLMEYENRLNEFFPGNQCLAICQYDRRRFDAAVLLGVLSAHPIAVIGTEVYDNFYYVAPAELLKGDPTTAMLRNWVKHLAERRRTEEALRLQGEIMTNMAEGVVLSRVNDAVITYTNPTLDKMFGYGAGELIGKHISVVNAPTEKSPEETANEIMASLNATGIWQGEVHNIKKDGTRFCSYASVSTFDDPEYGKVWISVLTDITERKRAEEELRKHREHLAELVEERTAKLQQEVAEHTRAAQELRTSKVLLEKTFASLSEAVFIVEPNTRTIIACNSAAEDIFGYSEKEMVGRNTEFLHVDRTGYEEFGRKLFLALDGNEAFHTEHQVRRKDGSVILTQHTVTEIVDNSGQRTGLVSVVRDVTERKLAEEELTKHRQHLAGLVEERTTELQQEVTERKRAEEALRGRTRELEIRDRIALIFLTVPDDEMYADVLDVILEALASEYGVFGYIDEKDALVVPSMTRRAWDKCQVPDKDIVFPRETWGDSTWVRAIREKRSIFSNEPSTNVPEGHVPIRRHIAYPIIYQGVVVGITEVANKETDYDENDIQLLGTITGKIAPVLAARVQRYRLEKQRKRAEEALRESEQRVRLLMDSTGEAIYGLDLDGNCTLCNPACLRLLGYEEPGDLLGKNMHDLIHHTRTDGKPYPTDECRIYRSFRQGEGAHVDDEVLWRADGTSFPAEYWSYPVKSGDEIVGSAVTFVDITERKRAEEAMRRLNKQLEEASRHKSEFLASLSHELRTPLNAILGASELLADGLFGKLNEKQAEYAGDIHESGTLLLSLINDVLDLSKVEAGKLDLHLSHFDLRSLMESSAVIVRERAASKSLDFNVKPPSEEVIVQADERKIKQIVYNLLSNAVKFTPEKGRVVFTAHQHGDEVIFAVEDTGPGIPDEFHERIFEEFFQTPGSQEGTGLGLTLAKRLVELHGGRIWLESDTGQGSRFFFAIPVAGAAPTGSGGLAAAQ